MTNFASPNLPSGPYRYSELNIPAHVDKTELAQMDTTPKNNPITDHGATLGRVLFYDKQLSKDNTVACASCHKQQHGFADPQSFSIGLDGQLTPRNTMSLANLRFTNLKGHPPGLLWDERAATLEEQALIPIQDQAEMGMELAQLPKKLKQLPYYPQLFQAAFGSTDISSERIANAIAQFVRSLVSMNAKFDRAANASGANDYLTDFDEFTDEENLGKRLFINGVGDIAEFGCAFCHIPPTFSMPKSFNNGLQLHYEDQGLGARGLPSNDPFTPSNDGKFKAPSLRNIELTAPYMHDGRFETLEEVVEHYSGGVHPHQNLGLAFANEASVGPTDTSGFQFNDRQKKALVAFLKTLTDRQFTTDPRFSDPFSPVSTSIVKDAPPVSTLGKGGANDDKPSAARAEYDALLKEFEEVGGARTFAKRFIEVAERNSGDPAALDALLWVIENVRARADTTRALDLLAEHFVDDERLAEAFPIILKARSASMEKLLRAALAKSQVEKVRVQACLSLAELLADEARVIQELIQQPEQAPRVLQYYGKNYGAHLAALDAEKLEEARIKVYERMSSKEFADVPLEDTTMGELGKRELYAVRYLSIGKVAPEITGQDVFGDEFKLSDFRGKVVMLYFWGHW